MEWLTYAVQIIAVLSFIGGVCSAIFRIVVIKPLSTSIDALSECVKELRDDVGLFILLTTNQNRQC